MDPLPKQPILFNRQKLRNNRNKAANTINNCPLAKYAADNIVENLQMLDRNFVNILDIGCRNGYLSLALLNKYNNATLIATDISAEMIDKVECTIKLLADEEELEFVENNFDLITFSLGLHWINNVPRFLNNIHNWLTTDGIFIANFIGGKSFKNLRRCLIEIETATNYFHSQHIPPFINFDHMVPLLQQANFQDIIVDVEEIDLEYDSAFALMKALKMAGESNIMMNMPNYSISKKMLTILKTEKTFNDQINMINFIVSKTRGVINPDSK
ncbi:BioC superfamily methyltransferase domain-containing protein [Candidatus Trichorickettsia mobilis]|uniref:BioC superfamily methyltransferase domain-containing protein n=1 Tax=Candidatus Trichorickettsia mobilis TaxID=1346319 RepID=A0ABZ0URG7_9RICK|nr:methyltransferase domain-containing protein [Candidatus Trichorickettsia mobilis]WPY00411.1 BioC superfamily methyltransferase domain-containing protein [Candidatus Trichorickettsia mobilis]